jgi:outer membrane autotransporter protein
MKRFLLTSCATGLVMTVLAGSSAWAQSYSVPTGTTQDVTTPISDSGSTPTAVSVTGGGTVILDGVNSYTGGTTVSGGSTVAVRGNDSAMGATSGALTLGDTTNSGTLLNASGSGALTVNRNISLNTGGGIIASGSGTAGQTNGAVTINGQISGSGGLTVSGPNSTVVLTNNNNNYTGTTSVIGQGQLVVSNDAQLGNNQLAGSAGTANTINLGDNNNSASLTVASGVSAFSSARNINLNAGGGIINGVTTPGGVAVFSGIVSGGGALSINSGTVELTNINNTYVGGTFIKGGATLQVTDDTVLGGSQATNVVLGDATSGGTLQFLNSAATTSSRSFVLDQGGGTILTNAAGDVTLTGVIENDGTTTDTGGLKVGGTGSLVLEGTNTFLGDVTVLKGATLAINADNALGAYTSTTNSVTGQVTSTANTNADGSLNLNALHLQGGQLEFTANATILHNIFTDAIGSAINTNNFNAVISSNIGGVGDLTKTGAGVLVLNGTNSYTGGTTINEGELIVGDSTHQTATLTGNVTLIGDGTANTSTVITTTTTTNSAGTSVTTNTTGNTILGGSGTISGTVINNGGIVAPANTLTVGGYIQNASGYLAPEITPSTTETSGSELKVTGTATIGGGTLSVGYGTGFLRAGQYQIFTASSISGSGFSTVNAGVVPSAGLTADVVQEGNSYYVALTQKTDLPDHPTVLPSLTQATIDQAQQTTGALLDRLANARSNALADELAVAMTDTHRVRGTSPYGLWVTPMGGTGSSDGGAGAPGYSTQTEGFMMGADTEWAPGVAIGVALGYTYTSLTEDSSTSSGSTGSKGSTSTPLLAVYGGWWSGPIAIDGLAAIGMGTIDATRALNLPMAGTTTPVAQVASSSHNGNEKIVAIQASGAWALDGWVVGPQFGAKYVNLRQSSYTETGTDIYNFTVASNSLNSLRPFLSADLQKRFFIGDHWALVPNLKAGYEHEINDKAAHIDSQTQGDQALWVYNGLLPGSDILRFVAGMKLELDRSEAFYVNYDRQQSSTGNSQLVFGGFRYRL